MLTVSPSMLELFELIRRVSRTEATVLVRGETGTGKELVARALHDLSPRADAPFRAINCATLTPELLASELFGHVKGAFTGAVQNRDGLFALADGGTIFLDEIAEIPLDIQARLLRVLQEQSFVPVGGTEPLHVDIRLISATHQSLRDAVDHHRFRADLMYRIRVVPLFLPPLRERIGDIEALTWHFIDAFNERERRHVEALTEPVLDAMLSYDWPGNVRELRNVIEYAYAIGEGELLTLDELTPELRGEPPPGGTEGPTTERELERERLLEALRKTGGKKGEAAELLDISRSTLWRKLKEHGISP
jgi:two-component system response regulator AtoC